jgi:hypothetical protein
MDSDDMKNLNNIYIKIFKKGKTIYSDSMENNIPNAQNLESYALYLNQMNEKLQNILHMTEKYALDCINKATDVRKYVDINNKYKDDPSRMILAHREMNNKMSWADITEMEDERETIHNTIDEIIIKPILENEFKHEKIAYKDISNIYGEGVDENCKIPIINNLNEMPSALYWFNGNKTNPKGVYICISHKFYVRIPFPNIVDGTKDFNRVCSVKCKYNTIDECIKRRREQSNRPNSFMRKCNFAHKGDKYVRVGSIFRCPNMIHFGRPTTIKDDLSNINEYNIKMMLLNSLSDLFISNLWFQTQKKKRLILTNIDIC